MTSTPAPGPRLGVLRHRFLRAVIPLSAAIIVAGGGALAALETDTVHSFGDGIWWALSLMTTVGFTGGTPSSTVGKVLSGFLMVGGFIVLATTTAAVASLFVREDEEPAETREQAVDDQILAALADLHSRLDRIEQRLDRSGG